MIRIVTAVETVHISGQGVDNGGQWCRQTLMFEMIMPTSDDGDV